MQDKLDILWIKRNAMSAQGMPQGSSGAWYPSMRTQPLVAETQSSNAINSRFQGRDMTNSMGNPMLSPCVVNEFNYQRGVAPISPQLNQVQGGGGYRDAPPDQDLHSQYEGQSPVPSSMGNMKGYGSPSNNSNRMGKVLPVQTDMHGRRLLQANFCTPSSSGGDSNLSIPPMVANGGVMCPPKITRSYTKVTSHLTVLSGYNFGWFLEGLFALQRWLLSWSWSWLTTTINLVVIFCFCFFPSHSHLACGSVFEIAVYHWFRSGLERN